MAIQLGDLKEAHKLAVEAQSEHKWKQLAELATAKSEFVLAQECLHRAQDFGGLLLLATSSGNKIFKICSHFKIVAKVVVTFFICHFPPKTRPPIGWWEMAEIHFSISDKR